MKIPSEVIVPMSSITKKITMNFKLTGYKSHKYRMWVVVRLLKLSAFILRTGIVINMQEDRDGNTNTNND